MTAPTYPKAAAIAAASRRADKQRLWRAGPARSSDQGSVDVRPPGGDRPTGSNATYARATPAAPPGHLLSGPPVACASRRARVARNRLRTLATRSSGAMLRDLSAREPLAGQCCAGRDSVPAGVGAHDSCERRAASVKSRFGQVALRPCRFERVPRTPECRADRGKLGRRRSRRGGGCA